MKAKQARELVQKAENKEEFVNNLMRQEFSSRLKLRSAEPTWGVAESLIKEMIQWGKVTTNDIVEINWEEFSHNFENELRAQYGQLSIETITENKELLQDHRKGKLEGHQC